MDIPLLTLSFLKYFLSGIFLLYLPGEFLQYISHRTWGGWKRATASVWLGISLFVFASYLLASVHLRWILLPVMVTFSLFGFVGFWRSLTGNREHWSGPHWFLIPFAFLFSLSVFTSGWMTDGTLVLKGVNGVDGIWNLALIEELIHTYPPEHPAIAGIPLRGYHLLYNLFVADFARLTGLAPVGLHFHFFSVILSVVLIYGIYALALRLTGSLRHSLWATFFALAGGSFSYILAFFWRVDVSLDDALGITQPFSLLVSPSFVLSLISVIYTWIFLDDYRKHPSLVWAVVLGSFAGLAVGMKVYAGIIVMPVIVWFVAWRLFTQKDVMSMILLLTSSVIAGGVFLPLNASYGFLRFQPLWPPHRVMQGVLDFTQWELKRQTLEQMGASRGLFKLEVIAMAIFIFGNLGTRTIGFFGLSGVKHLYRSALMSFIVIGCLVSFIIPMFFLQPIGAFNMIQFFWYFLVFLGILAGWGWSRLIMHIPFAWQVIVSVILLAATIPSAAEKIVMMLGGNGVSGVSSEELVFYRELRKAGNPGDMVLIVPYIDRYSEGDIRDWFNRTGPVIPAFTGKRTFLGNEVVQFPYDEWTPPRIKLLNIFLLGFNDRLTEGEKQAEALKQLQTLQEKYSIDFIVVPRGTQPWFIDKPWLRFLFKNEYGSLYQVHGLPQ